MYTVKEEDMKPEVLQDVLKWMYLLKIDNLEQKVSNRILQDVLKWMYDVSTVLKLTTWSIK